MAVKQVVVSDISGAELTDADHARVVVQHPDIAGRAGARRQHERGRQADRFHPAPRVDDDLEPDKAPRAVQMETKVLDRLFGDVDFDRVLEGARRADLKTVPPSQRPASRGARRRTPEKVDYTATDRFGQLHRGRITAEEARLVREHATRRAPTARRRAIRRSTSTIRPSASATASDRRGQPPRCRRQRASRPGSSWRRNSTNSCVSRIRAPAGVRAPSARTPAASVRDHCSSVASLLTDASYQASSVIR